MKSLAVALVVVFALTIGARPAAGQLRTQVVVSGLSELVGYVPDPALPGVFYAVQQSGQIRVIQDGTLLPAPFLDLSTQISTGGEQGLLGFVFSPNIVSGRVFVNFTNTQGHTVVARFRRSISNSLVADPATRLDLRWPDGNRFITQPFANHNGGHLAFGPDGYLYIGLGDGGSGNDPGNRAQDPTTLLGKMLRIDVNVPDADASGYRVPPDNPFLDGVPIAALGEIWDFGLRNPWRYTFDNPARGGTGALFIGDVGQSAREEVSYEPPASGGRNYGWSRREGAIATPGVDPNRPVAFTPLIDPLFDYPRSIGTTVTGGYVYRGSALGSAYVGRYFFADYGSGRVWSVGWQPSGAGAVVTDVIEHTSELGSLGAISSFAVDNDGELYVVIYSFGVNGRVLRLVPGGAVPAAPGNLTSIISGRDVTLDWDGSAGASQYRVEVGSRSGAVDVLQYETGSAQTALTATSVPDGIYYVRIRALNVAGASAPSNEIVVLVGCSGPPPAPTSLASTLSGRNVTLTWGTAGAPTSLSLEVGSGPGLSNVAIIPLPGSAQTVSGTVAPATYFARLRAIDACGVSAASNEIVVTVP